MRTVFRVTHNRRQRAWVVSVNSAPVQCSRSKSLLIRDLATTCHYMRVVLGQHSQVVIHGRDGRIQSERTYGNDPARRKG